MKNLDQVLEEINIYDSLEECYINSDILDVVVYNSDGILLTGNAQTLIDVASKQIKKTKSC